MSSVKGGGKDEKAGRLKRGLMRIRPKRRRKSIAKRSEFRERANLGLSTASVLMGATSLALALNRKGIDRTAGGTGPAPSPREGRMPTYASPSRRPSGGSRFPGDGPVTSLRQLTPQDIESSCRGKGVRYVVLKASGGNIGTFRYRPGEAEAFLSHYGRLGYWKKERVGDTLYYMLGN